MKFLLLAAIDAFVSRSKVQQNARYEHLPIEKNIHLCFNAILHDTSLFWL